MVDNRVDHYEINIAKGGKHWGTVIISDYYPESAAVEKLQYLRGLFGDEFKITMTRWESRGIVKSEWE